MRHNINLLSDDLDITLSIIADFESQNESEAEEMRYEADAIQVEIDNLVYKLHIHLGLMTEQLDLFYD